MTDEKRQSLADRFVDQDRSGDGIYTYRLNEWRDFSNLLDELETTFGREFRYVWRGQRRDDWSLSSTLDRLFAKVGAQNPEEVAQDHLRTFQYGARGRRGPNPAQLSDDAWWTIGQHYGLATPLLDWTRSPFAAAYFAFELDAPDPTPYRVVYGLNELAVRRAYEELENKAALTFVDPLIDDNPRLVSQGGIFTRGPIGVSVEQWVTKVFEGTFASVLVRIEIPNTDRIRCLRSLHRMNLNHLSLFPDLLGASVSANLKLELDL